jgi:hypothetical protein
VDRGREDLRRLAVWLARRRAVDEALAQLTHYGPAASERVHSHLSALRSLLAAEAEAFAALADSAPDVPQRPLPTEPEVELDDTVVSLSSERTRRQRQDS